jgi:hypothetical protein
MAITISGSGITSANIADGTITTDDILASDVKNLKSGRKNLIINGAMQVSQRGTTAGTPNTNNYLLDRFTHSRFGGYPDNATQSQVTDAPSGFTTSFKMIRNSAHTLTGTNATAFSQIMEGLNVSHLNWGTATARPITISFWVKSNQTGSFPLTLADSANAYDIGKLYVIGSADTWEYKTVNIEAPTTGTFDTGNTTSFTASWGFGSTSSARTAQGTTWGTSNASGSSKSMVTGASTALATTNGATWQITGVQLELGSVATDFEHRSYGEELALCQRYCVGIFADGSNRGFVAQGHAHNANNPVFWRQHSTPMRVIPSISYSSANDFNCDRGWTGNNLLAGLAIQTLRSSPECIALIGTTSGLVGGDPATLDFTDLINGYIIFDAEL